jgi:hypothetical protein
MLAALFARRVRGFRLIEVIAFGCLAAVVLAVYLTKAAAGRERAAITAANREIATERTRLRLLKAELAHLEQPERLERLSGQYLALGPVAAKREAAPEGLTEIARGAAHP